MRLPAGFCGIVGLKVTEGQLPTDGILPLSDTLIMYLTVKGKDAGRINRDRRNSTGLFAELHRGVAGLRLWVLDDAEPNACSEDVSTAYDAALDRLRHVGAELVTFCAQQSYGGRTATCGTLITAEGYSHWGHLYEQDDLPLDEDVRSRMLAGRDVTAKAHAKMLKNRVAARDVYLDRMTGLDAMLTPTTPTTAPLVDDVDQSIAPSYFTRHVNFFGMCALSVPAGLAWDGMPSSLQVIARPNDEVLLIRIGAAFEAL